MSFEEFVRGLMVDAMYMVGEVGQVQVCSSLSW
jgi:hypothetical protein